MRFVLVCCFTHMEGHTAYMTCNHVFSQKYYIHTLLLHNNDSLYVCICSINWFTALSRYIGSFGHKNKSMEVHDWLRHKVVFFWFGCQSRRAKCRQHWSNWLCLMVLPMNNIYIYIWFVTGKTSFYTKSYAEKLHSHSPTVLLFYHCVSICREPPKDLCVANLNLPKNQIIKGFKAGL